MEINEQTNELVKSNMEHDYISKIKKNVQHSMKNHCLVSMNVKVLSPGGIPRSEGKQFEYLIAERKTSRYSLLY